MRHRRDHRKLGRFSAHRKMLLRNLATALVTADRIVTTVAKAKELRRVTDRLVTLGKRGTLAARRRAARVLTTPAATKKLFDTLAPRFQGRPGGYTRVIHKGVRPGDGAPTAVVEWVAASEAPKAAAKKARPRAKRTRTPPAAGAPRPAARGRAGKGSTAPARD